MDDLTRQVLLSFARMGRDVLDLHELFEAGGNDPQARTMVLDKIEQLVDEGLMEERGNDFYSLTEPGKSIARSIKEDDLSP